MRDTRVISRQGVALIAMSRHVLGQAVETRVSQAAAPTGPSPPGISLGKVSAHLVYHWAGRCWLYHADIVAVEQNFRKLCVVSRVVTAGENMVNPAPDPE